MNSKKGACRHWTFKGSCPRGSGCSFAHDPDVGAPNGKGKGKHSASHLCRVGAHRRARTPRCYRLLPLRALPATPKFASSTFRESASRRSVRVSSSTALLPLAERQVLQSRVQVSLCAFARRLCGRRLQQDAMRTQPSGKEKKKTKTHSGGKATGDSNDQVQVVLITTFVEVSPRGVLPRRDRDDSRRLRDAPIVVWRAPKACPEAKRVDEHGRGTEDDRRLRSSLSCTKGKGACTPI